MCIFEKYWVWWSADKEQQESWQKIDANNTGIRFGDYTWKYLTIASGATTIENVEHAPDDIIIKIVLNWRLKI
jgi:hypothetical protein